MRGEIKGSRTFSHCDKMPQKKLRRINVSLCSGFHPAQQAKCSKAVAGPKYHSGTAGERKVDCPATTRKPTEKECPWKAFTPEAHLL